MNLYAQLKERQQKEVNSFPIAFAFNQKQFEDGMRELGLSPEETSKVVSIGGGGFIRKTDVESFHNMFKRHTQQIEKAINEDKNGTRFIKDMFSYELENHEYGYTRDITDTLEALDLTMEEIARKRNLFNGLQNALRRYK